MRNRLVSINTTSWYRVLPIQQHRRSFETLHFCPIISYSLRREKALLCAKADLCRTRPKVKGEIKDGDVEITQLRLERPDVDPLISY